jgi:hypothetical protein
MPPLPLAAQKKVPVGSLAVFLLRVLLVVLMGVSILLGIVKDHKI